MIPNSESELFSFIKNNYLSDLAESECKMSRYDCYSERHSLDIELKCRKVHYDELLIEKGKYDALLHRALRFNTRPLYINSTPNGVYVFDLKDIEEPEWFTSRQPKSTEFSNRQKVNKVIGLLPVSKAKNIYE